MIFVIPSLSREDTLMQKTLHLLIDIYCISPDKIHVFVIEEELYRYKNKVFLKYPSIHLHIGPLGLHHMRNYIHQCFPENTEIVCLDDDIVELKKMVIDESILDKKSSKRYPLQTLTKEEFELFLQDAFQELRNKNLHLFGIYPVKNGYFMKDLPRITYDLRFIVGCFWGCRNQPQHILHIEEKEDFERTLLYYQQDNGVLRYNYIAPVTSYYKEKGGMQLRDKNRKDTAKESCKYLLATFPSYCKLYTGKKSGMYEVRLHHH